MPSAVAISKVTPPAGAGAAGTLTDGGYNLEDVDSCGFSGTSLVNTDPLFVALGSFGGTTPTLAVRGDSPAMTALLKQALNKCLDVVYGNILRDGERPDPFMTKKAGIQAFDLAESLQAWSQAVGIYQRLTNSVWPQLPASLEKRAARAREKLERERAGN